jgi:hypothetical protein
MTHPTKYFTPKQKAFWHLKVLASATIISLIFAFVLNQKFTPGLMIMPLGLTFMQLELFIWLGNWFFESLQVDAPGFKRQIIIRLLVFYVVVLVLALLLFVVVYAIQYIIHFNDFSQFWPSLINMEMKGFFIATFVGFGIGGLFFFYVMWAEAVDNMKKLREEKLIFQYETLKSQVNPHFLFNSLNSLSSLIRKDPDLSEQFIQKLSSVYRYILDNREKELVPLATELEFVNNYFYLQKIRDEDKIILKNELKETEKLEVLPVSLQLLVENALKHNAATRKQPLEITIHSEGLDKLVVRNNLQKKMQFTDSSKIGLKNLNERSRLILKREIEIQETDDEFVVKIPVKLN